MKNIYRNNQLINTAFTKYSLLFMLFYVVIYCFTLLFATLERPGNIYDLLMDVGNFFTVSYMSIPLFLIILTAYYSKGSIQNYMVFRYRNKRHWYWSNVFLIGQIATSFTLVILFIMICQSIFVLDMTNQWSSYTLTLYNDSLNNLHESNPLVYAISTVVLSWFLLFFIGICFLLIFMMTKKAMLAFLAIIFLDLTNVIITLSKIKFLSDYFFTAHLDVFSFLTLHNLEASRFPFQLFIYWLLLILCAVFLGYFLINKRDLWIEKGDNNNEF